MTEPTRPEEGEIRLLRQAAEDAARMSRAAKIIGDLSDMVTRLQRERDKARTEVERLRTLLRNLGRHYPECASFPVVTTTENSVSVECPWPPKPCDCWMSADNPNPEVRVEVNDE